MSLDWKKQFYRVKQQTAQNLGRYTYLVFNKLIILCYNYCNNSSYKFENNIRYL